MNSFYTQYYLSQLGKGLNDIGPIYKSPIIYQRGRGGVGSLFSGIIKYLRPLFWPGLNAIKNQAMKSGTALLADVGKNHLNLF